MEKATRTAKWSPEEEADFANFCQQLENSADNDSPLLDEREFGDEPTHDEWWAMLLPSC